MMLRTRFILIIIMMMNKLRSSLWLKSTVNLSKFTSSKRFDNGRLYSIDRNSNNNKLKAKVVFVLGGPGAGKGTQCEKLSQEFGIVHLSAGELLREERLKPTDNGKLIDSYLKEGKIVPVEISLKLLRQAISDFNSNRYLIDGFPRNWDNLNGWNQLMHDICEVESVLFIDCEENELEQRLISRGKYSGRDDDNVITARKRFQTFKESTLPIINHFENEEKSILSKVDGSKSIEVVYDQLKKPIIKNIQNEIIFLTNSIIKNNYNMEILNPIVEVQGKSANIRYDIINKTTNSEGELQIETIKENQSQDWKLINRRWVYI